MMKKALFMVGFVGMIALASCGGSTTPADNANEAGQTLDSMVDEATSTVQDAADSASQAVQAAGDSAAAAIDQATDGK
jgi:hypothetical protein